jgi:hypothetical protein
MMAAYAAELGVPDPVVLEDGIVLLGAARLLR